MLILIIICLIGLIFGLSLILYFTSKEVIGDSKEYDKLDEYAELDVGSCDKATQQDKEHE